MTRRPWPGLTEAETRVCEGVALGHRLDDIAIAMNTKRGTVYSHRNRARRKMGVINDVQLTRFAIAHGLMAMPALSETAIMEAQSRCAVSHDRISRVLRVDIDNGAAWLRFRYDPDGYLEGPPEASERLMTGADEPSAGWFYAAIQAAHRIAADAIPLSANHVANRLPVGSHVELEGVECPATGSDGIVTKYTLVWVCILFLDGEERSVAIEDLRRRYPP